jgi:hypothetical protein
VKRILASVLAAVALAACGSPLASETPQQALAGAAQRASQLKSAKFDLQGGVTMTLPAALGQTLGSAGGNGTVAVNLSGTGEAEFPDRYHAVVTVKMQGFSVATEAIVANGKAYVKNPLTNKWEASPGSAGLDQLGQDPLSYNQLLKNVKSIKDDGDTTINGTTVHHYELTPDTTRLLNSLNTSSMSPQAVSVLKQVLNNGKMTIQVWFGKDDHLVRRVATDADYSIDLNQFMGALGSATGASGARLPAGSTIHATARVVINYHDFDSPVTISIPTIG